MQSLLVRFVLAYNLALLLIYVARLSWIGFVQSSFVRFVLAFNLALLIIYIFVLSPSNSYRSNMCSSWFWYGFIGLHVYSYCLVVFLQSPEQVWQVFIRSSWSGLVRIFSSERHDSSYSIFWLFPLHSLEQLYKRLSLDHHDHSCVMRTSLCFLMLPPKS